MSRLRVPVEQLAAGTVQLDQGAAHYVARVHRLARGDRFVAFDPVARREALAEVLSVRRGAVMCRIDELAEASLVASRPLWLLVGVCKADRLEWALREASALGVTDIVPLLVARSVAGSRSFAASRAERWRRICVEGSRQCGRGDVAVLHEAKTLQEAIDLLPAGGHRVCLWEHASRPLREVLSGYQHPQPIVVAIGPEGGFEQAEAKQLEDFEFAITSLGPYVLRVETAVVAALGAIEALVGGGASALG